MPFFGLTSDDGELKGSWFGRTIKIEANEGEIGKKPRLMDLVTNLLGQELFRRELFFRY